MGKREVFLVISGVLLGVMVFLGSAQDDKDTLVVSANIITNYTAETIGIQVTDYLFIGNVSVGEDSGYDNNKISINNTGNVDIIVTPELKNESDNIAKHFYFKKRTTSSYNKTKIGDFSMEIDKPSNGVRSDYTYFGLDLTDFNGTLETDIINYTAEIRFVAVKKI